MRHEDGEHALQLAVVRRMDEHFSTNETINEVRARGLQDKERHTQVTVFYKPDLDHVCKEKGFLWAYPRGRLNWYVDPRRFRVNCQIRPFDDRFTTVYDFCKPDYFCVTVLKGTQTVVDPTHIRNDQRVEPACQKSLYFKLLHLTSSLYDSTSEWWTAPGKFKVIFGRMNVLGDTSGVDYNLIFEWKHVKSTLWSVAGIKNIEASNTGSQHEYELFYNYNGATDMQSRAATEGFDEVSGSKNIMLNVYSGVAS